MINSLRVLGHLLRGRTSLWQCYTSVTPATCAACLARHGRIVDRPTDAPALDTCSHELRRFPVWKLRAHRAMGHRMEKRAQEELRRRSLFERALAMLPMDPQTGLALFDQAAAINVYLPEIEALGSNRALADPDLRAQVREIHLVRWKSKFATERYERQPELARAQQEQWGVQRIRELFS